MCQKCAEDQSINDQLNSITVMGVFFGYPECCINWFIKRAIAIRIGIAHGQNPYEAAELPENQSGFTEGFIPCPSCAAKTSVGEEGSLITDRICSKPYPNDEYHPEELETFVRYLITAQLITAQQSFNNNQNHHYYGEKTNNGCSC